MDPSGFEEFGTARGFLERLDVPFGIENGAYDPRRWLFRGVRDADFELVPTALRAGIAMMSPQTKTWETADADTEWDQIRREVFSLHQFFASADAEGITLPEDSQALRLRLNETLSSDFEKQRESLRAGESFWPPDALLSISGLAQHYLLPTRLLDWTYHPLVAAYFAASEAADDFIRGAPRRSKKLAVWALSQRAVSVTEFLAQKARTNPDPQRAQLHLVSVPTATNPNLRAQYGLFVLMRPECVIPEAPVKRWDLCSVVTSLVNGGEPNLCQWVLPISEAPELLRLLAHKFISAASVNPGLWGVVRALKERGRWDARPQVP